MGEAGGDAAEPFDLERFEGGLTVRPESQALVDLGAIETFFNQVDELVRKRKPKALVIDLSRVQHISSSTLGRLMALRKRLEGRGGKLRIINASEAIYDVFVVTKLIQHIPVKRRGESRAVGGPTWWVTSVVLLDAGSLIGLASLVRWLRSGDGDAGLMISALLGLMLVVPSVLATIGRGAFRRLPLGRQRALAAGSAGAALLVGASAFI